MRNIATYINRVDLANIANWRAVAFCLLCGVIGFVLNLHPVHLFSDLTLVFGPAFSILVALSVGPVAGAMTAAVVSTALFWSWDNPYAVLFFVLEAFVVGWLYRKEWNELLAVSVFWLSLGVPAIFASLYISPEPDFWLDLVGKYIINSFLYTLSASALLWGLSIPRWLNLGYIRSYTLRTQIFTILMVCMAIPIAAVFVVDAQKRQKSHIDRVKTELTNNSHVIAQRLDLYLRKNQLVIEKQAELIGIQTKQDITSLEPLAGFHAQNPSFVTLLIADTEGNLINYSPDNPGFRERSIDDRDYFIAAREGRSFLSNAFLGRGFGTKAIVAISAPIKSTAEHRVVGVLEGSLDLQQLEEIANFGRVSDFPQQVIISDAADQVVYASHSSRLPLLTKVDWQQTPASIYQGFFHSNVISQATISGVAESLSGWKVRNYYLFDDFNQQSRQRYRNLAIALTIIIIIVGSLAAFLSYQINGPISWLLNKTLKFNLLKEQSKPIQISPLVPTEMVALMRAYESAERRLKLAFETERLHQLKRDHAEKANDAKSDFLSSMSHELRTPLNAISGFSQLLNVEESLPDSAKVLANEIQVASQHLMLLINDILDLSKIESGQLELDERDVDLGEVLQEAVSLMQGMADVNNIHLKVKHCENITVRADALRLKQIVINLVSNAIKYNRPQGRVVIEVNKLNGKECNLVIRDTGLGIEQSQIDELFKPFSRIVREGLNIEGYGIGLAVTKKLLELMGGSIEVTSIVGEGSKFSVLLPTVDAEFKSELKSEPQSEPHTVSNIAPCKIIYIEDNHLNAMVMEKAMLRYPQIDYTRVTSGKEGLSKLQETSFDFVFLDISLPDINGIEVLKTMQKELSYHYRFAFALSANALTDDINRGLAAGFDQYVTKPIKFDDLFKLIHRYQN